MSDSYKVDRCLPRYDPMTKSQRTFWRLYKKGPDKWELLSEHRTEDQAKEEKLRLERGQ